MCEMATIYLSDEDHTYERLTGAEYAPMVTAHYDGVERTNVDLRHRPVSENIKQEFYVLEWYSGPSRKDDATTRVFLSAEQVKDLYRVVQESEAVKGVRTP